MYVKIESKEGLDQIRDVLDREWPDMDLKIEPKREKYRIRKEWIKTVK